MKLSLYSIIVVCLAALGAQGQGQSPVTATVSTTRAAANEIFHFTISASGSDVKDPDISALSEAGLQLGSPSVQSSTSIQSVNGRTTVMQSRTWRYPASASSEGTIIIPRIAVTIDGQEYFTQPITLEITRSVEIGTETPDGNREITVEDLAFVRAVADKTTLYQGDALTLRLRLYVLEGNYVSVDGPRSLPMPDTEGFYPGPQWQSSITEQYYGRAYRVTEFNRVLYPAMPGELFIGSWNWQGAVRWHDARRRMQTAARMFTTNEIPITVLPLPEKPEGFGGAVGKFRVQAQLAQQSLTQGTPVRFTITISGEGNPNTISAPMLPEMSWAHVSGPETDTQQQENSPVVTKTFSYLLTPLETGEHAVPPATFIYFAPAINNYKTEQTREYPVTISPAKDGGVLIAAGGSAVEQRNRIEVFEDGILPIITDVNALSAATRPPGGRLSRIALLSPALPWLIFAVLYVFLAWRGRLASDRGYARRFYAKRRFLKRLNAAHTTADPAEMIYQALKGFVADMFDITEAGLTAAEVQTTLQERNVNGETIDMVVRVLSACERTRYTGRNSVQDEVDALYAAAGNAVEQLQADLQEKRR